MRAGIKSNSICRTSPDVHTAQIMWKHCAYKSMQTVEYVAFTSLTGYIQKTNYHPNSNCSYRFKNHQRKQLRRPKPPEIEIDTISSNCFAQTRIITIVFKLPFRHLSSNLTTFNCNLLFFS